MSRRIVALGGGHGLYATLSAARRLTPHVTAVVTVADDGGSSGRLRSELEVVPPGDLRMALAALASDSPHGRLWATIMQHRFGGSGALSGHPIGNLLLAGLNEVLADPVAALDELGRVLGVRGRVLPMCPIALQIEADVSGLEADPRMFRAIRGQVAIATTPGKVRRVRLPAPRGQHHRAEEDQQRQVRQVQGVRDGRQAAGAALYEIMSDLVFRTTSTDRTVLQAVADAAEVHGWKRVAVEDPITGSLSYKRMLLGANVLGRKLMPLAAEGKALGVMLPNANGAVVTILAVMSGGRVPAPPSISPRRSRAPASSRARTR